MLLELALLFGEVGDFGDFGSSLVELSYVTVFPFCCSDAGSVERDSISASGTERFASCTSFDLARA
jgi:hypothetical protein